MRILLTSEYDSEVLLENDISPVAIHHELIDRAVEIEVSIEDIAEWLSTHQQSLVVAEDYGDIISIVKHDFDTFPTMFVEYDSLYNTDDLFNQVVEYPSEVEAIEMDIGAYPYEHKDVRERLRRWVESHPIQWYRLPLSEISEQLKMSSRFVWKHLPECAISAKYVDTIEEYKQKRQSRSKVMPQSYSKRSLEKLQDWLRRNYHLWQSKTFVEICEETDLSRSTVFIHLPKLLLAEGFISDMSDYKRKRKECRGKKGKVNQPAQYLIDVV